MATNEVNSDSGICPLCAKNGANSMLRLYRFNFHEGVFLCPIAQCPYPGNDPVTIKTISTFDDSSDDDDAIEPNLVENALSNDLEKILDELRTLPDTLNDSNYEFNPNLLSLDGGTLPGLSPGSNADNNEWFDAFINEEKMSTNQNDQSINGLDGEAVKIEVCERKVSIFSPKIDVNDDKLNSNVWETTDNATGWLDNDFDGFSLDGIEKKEIKELSTFSPNYVDLHMNNGSHSNGAIDKLDISKQFEENNESHVNFGNSISNFIPVGRVCDKIKKNGIHSSKIKRKRKNSGLSMAKIARQINANIFDEDIECPSEKSPEKFVQNFLSNKLKNVMKNKRNNENSKLKITISERPDPRQARENMFKVEKIVSPKKNNVKINIHKNWDKYRLQKACNVQIISNVKVLTEEKTNLEEKHDRVQNDFQTFQPFEFSNDLSGF